MNVCIIIGRLATDVELRHTNNGKAVANFRIAVNRPGQDDADFFSIVMWEKSAEAVAAHFHKGKEIALEGRLQQKTWEQDGQKRSSVEINAHRWEFIGPKSDDAGEYQPSSPAQTTAPADDIPF